MTAGAAASPLWDRLNRLRKNPRLQLAGTLGLVGLGPVLAVLTFGALGLFEGLAGSKDLRAILLADMVYVLVVAALILQRIARMVAARRAQSAGSRLHLRLTGVFALMALLPTVLVAVFATATLNFGLEGWFSDRVREVVGNSLRAAQAYQREHREGLLRDARLLAEALTTAKRRNPLIDEGGLRVVLSRGQAQIQSGLREAFVIDGRAKLILRGERSYLFDYEPPTPAQIDRAATGEAVVIEDWDNNEFRALVKLDAFADRYLYVTRVVDGSIFKLLDETQQSVRLYQQLEQDRGRLLFEFGLIYMGFAVIVILAAIWLGLWFAERLAGPVGRLAGAVQRVGAGDLDARVPEEEGDDEIALLSRVFNSMTRQLKTQRDSLIASRERAERRRRLFDSVLSGVTTGVIGLNPKGEIDILNAAARRLLGLEPARDTGRPLTDAVPEFAYLFDELSRGHGQVVQSEVQVTRAGSGETLLVRLATRHNAEGRLEGYVVTFDDVTDLVNAQRMAAWGDVARRIAHEIKNPLTPIQLSAGRIRRKFANLPGVDTEAVAQYTDVIIRQTEDLRRIVDEFSRFARMPEPDRRWQDLLPLIRDAVTLQQNRLPGVKVTLDCPEGELWALIDQTMISQALTNLLKNAGEAIEAWREAHPDAEGCAPEIRVAVGHDPERRTTSITIADNGIGLPENRTRLFEPYVTTREKGTGLGLPIVKKIVEEHGGTLELDDAEIFPGCDHAGAMARIVLPETTTTRPDEGRRATG